MNTQTCVLRRLAQPRYLSYI